MTAEPTLAQPPKPQRKRAKDEDILAVVLKVILQEGTISSQRRLNELVNHKLRRKNMRVTGPRVRTIAIRSGLIGINMRIRHNGETPDLTDCPVCQTRLKRTGNRTLTGGTTKTGYKCPRCPWWTGRDLRTPQHYTFYSKVARTDDEPGQLAFLPNPQRRL